MKSPAEDHLIEHVINPYYAINFADHLFVKRPELVAKEDWVLSNSKLIDEMSNIDWLNQLLVSLATTYLDSPTFTIICPANTVSFTKRLKGTHKPAVDVDDWVAANEKLQHELDVEAWLWKLLSVLETGGEAT